MLLLDLDNQLPSMNCHHRLEFHAINLSPLEFQSKLPWGF